MRRDRAARVVLDIDIDIDIGIDIDIITLTHGNQGCQLVAVVVTCSSHVCMNTADMIIDCCFNQSFYVSGQLFDEMLISSGNLSS